MHKTCCAPECAQEHGQARKLLIYTLCQDVIEENEKKKVKINLDDVTLVPLMYF